MRISKELLEASGLEITISEISRWHSLESPSNIIDKVNKILCEKLEVREWFEDEEGGVFILASKTFTLPPPKEVMVTEKSHWASPSLEGWKDKEVKSEIKYPLVESLGLEVKHDGTFKVDFNNYVIADQLETVLKAGVPVFSHIKGDHKPAYWGPTEQGQYDDTHTGLVINIRSLDKPKPDRVTIVDQIQKHLDEAEKLCKELLGGL